MHRTEITIEQIEEPDGTRQINVSGVRDGRIYFSESFDVSNDMPLNIHLFDEKRIENRHPVESLSMECLRKLGDDIQTSIKTNGNWINEEQANVKFPFMEMLCIRNFEKLANLKFDYSKFKTLREFQMYFSGLLK